MTAETLLYAVGGGHGHAVRGMLLASRLRNAGVNVAVVIRRGALEGVDGIPRFARPREISSPDDLHGVRASRIIVDTFPQGWWGELQPLIQRCSERVFVARHRSDLDWQAVESLFQEVWLPYSAQVNEWDTFPVTAKMLGILRKPHPTRIEEGGRAAVLYDPEHRCSTLFHVRLRELVTSQGLTYRVMHRLPATLEARRFLAVGAGYNTFYELAGNGPHIRFLPVRKRFDDQFHRTKRFNRGVTSFDEMRQWLHVQ